MEQTEVITMLGKSIKVCLKDELEPFYLKVQGCAKNGESFHGVSEEGENKFIRTNNIEWILNPVKEV